MTRDELDKLIQDAFDHSPAHSPMRLMYFIRRLKERGLTSVSVTTIEKLMSQVRPEKKGGTE